MQCQLSGQLAVGTALGPVRLDWHQHAFFLKVRREGGATDDWEPGLRRRGSGRVCNAAREGCSRLFSDGLRRRWTVACSPVKVRLQARMCVGGCEMAARL